VKRNRQLTSFSYPDLHQEVSQMLLELGNILIKAEQALDEDFDLSTEKAFIKKG
jgi:hypothetical protein